MGFADAAIERTVKHEGGYSNNPSDSGGETMWGITARVARAYGYVGEMRDMPRAEAKRIYFERFWRAQNLDDVAVISLDLATEIFDTGVNLGETAGAKFLQRLLNVLNMRGAFWSDTVVDGRIGRMTLAALSEFKLRRGDAGMAILLRSMNDLQAAFYIELAERREKDEEFIYGWLANRVA